MVNALSNKILKSQLTPYTILYIIIDNSQTLTDKINKKKLTKLLFSKNFNLLKKSTFIYPISYISTLNSNALFKTYLDMKKHKDFKKIIICNIKLKSLIFKNFTTLQYFNLNNTNNIYYKLYLLLNKILFSFIFLKKNLKE